MLQSLTPMLEVQNIDESISFYEQKLGFKCVGKQENEWARLEKDRVSIMLTERYSQKEHSKPTLTGSIYIETNQVDELWEKLKSEVKISYPIETFEYGMREFAFFDLDGYMIQFGQGVT